MLERKASFLSFLCLISTCHSFTATCRPPAAATGRPNACSSNRSITGSPRRLCSLASSQNHHDVLSPSEALAHDPISVTAPIHQRRSFFKSFAAIAAATASLVELTPLPAVAASSATESAEITDRVYFVIKGLPTTSNADDATTTTTSKRIVIGLFGKDAPESVAKLKQLVTTQGLPAKCQPRAERVLQKEQLEANKVYNSCIEGEKQGVSLQYTSIWRVIKDERIDMGAVSGKFVAREYPTWSETTASVLKHNVPGTVSVRRGNDSGFGFTIFPGGGTSFASTVLDEDNIVVGRVIEGMDVVQQLNDVPVIKSANVNYMLLTGGPTTTTAPTRSCRYGGPMYCNENKPLIKLSITDAGIL